MDLQKKRTSNRKNKLNKSQAQLELPLAPLMQEINQLKTQLANMKSKKNLKSMKELQDPHSRPSKDTPFEMLPNKSELNKTAQKLVGHSKSKEGLKQIMFPIRDSEMKINIELNKLFQNIKDNNQGKSVSTLNKLVTTLNTAIRDLETQNRGLSPQEQEFLHPDWKKQARVYQQLNNELEKQNIQLKHMLAKQNDEFQELQLIYLQMKEEFEVMAKSLISAEDQIQKGRIVCGGLREQRRELEEKLKVYERSIEKKQSELLLYEQDISYTRMETEKNKMHKRQLEKLFENLQKEHRELKNKYDVEVQALTNERNKWKSECEGRRAVDKQILTHQQQKTQLKKELQGLRRQYASQSEELSLIKQKLCEEQKKLLTQQQKNFRIQTQNQKLQRSVQFCKAQMRQLAKQVQELRDESSKYRDIALRSKMGVKNSGKAQALQEIQQLIKFHRRNQNQS